jgi:hypothetical protein
MRRQTSSKARTRQGLFHTPLPCFLEVLILHDFKSFEPEVLILGGFKSLFPEVLILVEFKCWRMSEMQKIEIFLEVLILGELGHGKCGNGGNWEGKKKAKGREWDRGLVHGVTGRAGQIVNMFGAEGGCLQDIEHVSTMSGVMSILSMSYSNKRACPGPPLSPYREGMGRAQINSSCQNGGPNAPAETRRVRSE